MATKEYQVTFWCVINHSSAQGTVYVKATSRARAVEKVMETIQYEANPTGR
jgi:hypothetical protein